MNRVVYIIYASDFDENVGGVIALHHLCHLLNQVGERAFLWPSSSFDKHIGKIYWPIMSIINDMLRESKFITFENFETPVASSKHLSGYDDVVVVYPEVVSGNPLKAKNVVRWFLNKPGALTGEVNYGPNELYFYYSKHFDDIALSTSKSQQLKTLYIRDDIYYDFNKGEIERQGSCHIIRKGKGKQVVHDISDSILIDGMPHNEIASVFNKVKYCISYDPYTMLSKYAAICGCVSIVIPDNGVSKEEWRPIEEDRYGVAYGFEDIDWAIQTQDMALENFRKQELRMIEQVKNFARETKKFFFSK